MTDWIPIEERKPKEGRKVLITYRHAADGELTVITDRRKHDPQRGMIAFMPERTGNGTTLAWQPLPKPYKDDG